MPVVEADGFPRHGVDVPEPDVTNEVRALPVREITTAGGVDDIQPSRCGVGFFVQGG